MRALIRKDLGQHAAWIGPGLALSCLLAIVCLGRRLTLGGHLSFGAEAAVQGVADFVLWVLTPLAVLWVQQLVAVEVRDGGLRLLRTLPVGTGRVFLGKLLCAVVPLALLAGCAVGAAGAVMRLGEDWEPALLQELLQGSLSWLALVVGLALVWASLGRLRHEAALLAALVLVALPELWSTSAPGRLVAAHLVEDRGQATWTTLAVGGGAALLAWLCWTVRGGAWLEPLAGRWAAREAWRAAVLGLVLVGLLQARVGPPPPLLSGRVARDGGVVVRVVDAASQPRAEALAAQARAVLEQVAQLGAAPSGLAIEHGEGWSADHFARARGLPPGRLLIRLNTLATPGPGFRPWLATQILDAGSQGRLRAEAWRPLLDGLGAWLAGSLGAQERLRAAWGLRRLRELGTPLGSGVLARWDTVRAQLGDPIARALAGWILLELEREAGRPAVVGVYQRALRARLAGRGLAGLGAAALGRSPADWERDLAGRARELEAALGEQLARLPALPQAALDVVPGPHRQLKLAAEGAGRVLILHALADGETAPALYDRDEGQLGGEAFATDASYGRGARLCVTCAVWAPALGCELIQGWQELQLP